jgi:NTE family protein
VRVALVLGAGGARGYAHLGVLEVLRERGHEVVAIAGTSMGALVGGLAAAGQDEEFAAYARTLTQRGVLRLMDPSISGPGAVRGNKIIEKIEGFLGDTHIEELSIPFTAVAADLTNQREVWFQRGPLMAAIRASIAIPGALTPVEMGGRFLVDGGILNPLPVGPILGVDADLTVAVDLSAADRGRIGGSPVHEEASVSGDQRTWLRRIGFSATDAEPESAEIPAESAEIPAESAEVAKGSRRSARSRIPVRSRRKKPKKPDLRAMDVMLGSFETMQAAISRYHVATNPPDVMVSIPLAAARTLEFHRANELIELGRSKATEALDHAGH